MPQFNNTNSNYYQQFQEYARQQNLRHELYKLSQKAHDLGLITASGDTNRDRDRDNKFFITLARNGETIFLRTTDDAKSYLESLLKLH